MQPNDPPRCPWPAACRVFRLGATYNYQDSPSTPLRQRSPFMFPRTPLHAVVFLFLMQLATVVRAEDNQTMLFDFSKPDAAKAWQTVNDGVMGGVSDGKVRITEKNLEFYGTLSLENNGGFASVRSKAAKMDLSKYDGLVFKVRGDGRDYYLNVHVPTYQIAFSYRASFKTEKDKWTEVTIPFTDLKATSFGRVVEKGKPLNPSNVEAVGFLLADKKAGPFKLEVAWIKGTPKAGK